MITLADIERLKRVINITTLEKISGLAPKSLHNKLANKTELTVIESYQIDCALKKYGLMYIPLPIKIPFSEQVPKMHYDDSIDPDELNIDEHIINLDNLQ